nr:AUGMIN subunit 4 [Ipomoea batatas]
MKLRIVAAQRWRLPLISIDAQIQPISLMCFRPFNWRAKLVIEEIEREEASLREDLYSPARKFAEYYNIWTSFTYPFSFYLLFHLLDLWTELCLPLR